MDLTRKQFLHLFAGAGAAALGVSALGACDDDSSSKPPDAPPAADAPPADAPPADAAIDAPPMGNCTMNGTVVMIGGHAGHVLVVTQQEIMDAQQKDYNIQGTSGHPHTVTITAGMFMMLQQNMQVTVTSTVDAGHPHTVMIRCA